MVNCPRCFTEVPKSRKSKETSGFYLVTYHCSSCGSKFKLEEWIG